MKKTKWLILSILVVLIDQLSKHWAVTHLIPYQSMPLIPMVNFTLAYNTGAAFSFLSGAGSWHQWFFTVFSLAMSIFLIIWLIKTPARSVLQPLAISLILGGAVGNLYDRFTSGHVIDFIDVYYKTHHWPIFNPADMAICIGAVLLFIDLYKNRSEN